jgi:hypothetical protein
LINNHGFTIHNTHQKKERRRDYDIYKENHPVTPKQVVNMFDLIFRSRKGFPTAVIIYAKKRKEI